MKLKKCGFLLSLFMMVCFAIPSFASAESVNLVANKLPSIYDADKYKNVTDSDMNSYTNLLFGIDYVFDSLKDVTGFSLKTTGVRSIYVKYYDESGAEIKKYEYTLGENEMVRGVKRVSIEPINSSSFSVFDFKLWGQNAVEVFEDVKNINGISGVKDVNFVWQNPKSSKYKSVKIFAGDKLVADVDKSKNAYKVDNLEADKEYEFKFVAQYEGGNQSDGVIKKVKTLVDPDTLPPPNVIGLKVIDITEKSAVLQWVNPKHINFDGVKIYADNKLLTTLEKDKTTYKLDGLKPEKTYKVKVTSINRLGGETEGSMLEVNTTQPVLEPPKGIIATPQNESLYITWDRVDSPYLKGYNVYVNGKKVNGELLTLNKLTVNGLKNGEAYKIEISAVNKNGVEGKKSELVSGKPSEDAITVNYDVKIPFSPLDLLTSSVSLLAILGGFVLLSIAIIWFKPLKELIVRAVRRREKDKK